MATVKDSAGRVGELNVDGSITWDEDDEREMLARLDAHERWLASEAADYLFENGHGE